MTERRGAVDGLYDLLDRLEASAGRRRRLRDCTSRSGWPRRGVYFFFEDGELREDGVTPRVVRVGTHGLRPSSSTLWKRLSQHRGNVGGSNPGGGNHRGSVFRLHVGSALLASGRWPEPVESWGQGSNAPAGVRELERGLERAVSEVIGSMHVLWLDVDDEPSAQSLRGVIEAGVIALLSNAGRSSIDPPSERWLGSHAARPAIRDSGLWNVNHISDPWSPEVLSVVAGFV